MAPDSKGSSESGNALVAAQHRGNHGINEDREDAKENGEDDDEEEEEDDDEEEEPRLKYASLTKGQAALYKNGDAASAFLVAGDKMVGKQHRETAMEDCR